MPKTKKNSWKEIQRARQKQQPNIEKRGHKKRRRLPKGKIAFAISLIIFIFGVIAIWQYVTAPFTPKSFTIIHIRADGSVDPSNASISTVENNRYVLTANIYGSIVIERNMLPLTAPILLFKGRVGRLPKE